MRLSDPLAQVIIVGLVCFCCPGMFNALNATGTFGLDPKDSDVGNIAGTALGAVFAVSSLFAGALFNIFGHRLLLILGGLSYALYASSFLAYNYIQSIAFVVIASCLIGVGAGWLWCAQGAIMMGYPEEGEKGKYFSVFWAIFNCGGVLGNVIPLSIQWNDEKAGGASTTSYAVFISLMSIGAFISLLLLPASKVTRKDGSPVTTIKYSSPINELKSVFALFKDWRMLALIPMFWASNWFYTYQFTYNSVNFTTRTRSMNSMTYWLAQIIASVLYGRFLDRKQWSRTTRARYGLLLLAAVMVAVWVGGVIAQAGFGPKGFIVNDKGVSVKDPKDYHNIDLVKQSGEYVGHFFLYFAYGMTDAMYQGYAYWIMGALTNDTSKAARFSGFYKFIQNLGAIFAPLVQTSVIGIAPKEGSTIENATSRGMGELIIVIVMVFIGILGAVPVAWKAVKEHTVEEDETTTEKQEAFEDVKA